MGQLTAGAPRHGIIGYTVMISFSPWLPAVILVLGIALLRPKGIGYKIASVILIFVGGLLLALQVLVYLKRPR